MVSAILLADLFAQSLCPTHTGTLNNAAIRLSVCLYVCRTGLPWGRNFVSPYPRHTHTHGNPHGDSHTDGRLAVPSSYVRSPKRMGILLMFHSNHDHNFTVLRYVQTGRHYADRSIA